MLYADEQIRINQLIIKEIAAQRYPTVRASTGYTYSGNNASAGQLLLNQSYGPFVGLSMNIPIYNGSIYRRQQKIAEINARTTGIYKDMLVRDYRAEIVKTYRAYAVTLQQLESQQKNYQLAQQLQQLVLQRFQFRQATIVDVAQAQQSFITAAYSLVNYSFVAKSAEIELKRVSNQLTF
jgi:outer membrane protein